MAPTKIDLLYIKSLSWSTTSSYTISNIITYNISLGCPGSDLSLCYEGHPEFHALPTFGSLPVIKIMSKVTRSMPSFLPNFQPHNHVHGEHYLELKRPFPPKDATLKTTAKIVDVVDRRSGVTVSVGIWTRDEATSEEICYNEWTSFIMKVPGEGAASKPTQRGSATALHPAPNRPADKIVAQKTSAEQSALYRAASGDLNPLHIDPDVAKKGGFPGPILTGTCTLGMGVRHILETVGKGKRFKSVKLRLSKPVFPGEELKTEVWVEDGGRKVVYRQSVGDRVVMKDAAVELIAEDDAEIVSLQRSGGVKL